MIRRAWRVLADPPGSETAALLRCAVPFALAYWLLSLSMVHPPVVTLSEIGWAYAVLWVVRQRDEARAPLNVHPGGGR